MDHAVELAVLDRRLHVLLWPCPDFCLVDLLNFPVVLHAYLDGEELRILPCEIFLVDHLLTDDIPAPVSSK